MAELAEKYARRNAALFDAECYGRFTPCQPFASINPSTAGQQIRGTITAYFDQKEPPR